MRCEPRLTAMCKIAIEDIHGSDKYSVACTFGRKFEPFFFSMQEAYLKLAESTITLKKDSTEPQIRSYFEHICNLADNSGEEFPANLDDVWPLVYGRKEEAVRALTTDFQYSEDVDYKVLRRNAQNPLGGRPASDYFLSVSCLEHFIARKVRSVFEVYRQVFHAARRGELRSRNLSRKELALMVIQAEEEKERLMLENKMQAAQLIEAAPKIDFHDKVVASEDTCLIRELAKILAQRGFKIGQNRLYELLRNEGYLIKSGIDRNQPTQQYVEYGIFEVDMKPWINPKTGEVHIGKTSKVTPKGIKYFVRKFLGKVAL